MRRFELQALVLAMKVLDLCPVADGVVLEQRRAPHLFEVLRLVGVDLGMELREPIDGLQQARFEFH